LIASTKSRTCSKSSLRSNGSTASPHLEIEVDKLQVDRKIQSPRQEADGEGPEEYYLNEKMKRSRRSWGARTRRPDEVDELKKKIET